MPSEVANKKIVPEMAQEVITLMDDFGTQHLVQIPVSSTAAQRTDAISTAKAMLDTNETTLVSYAAANNHDITTLRANGIAARVALQTKNGIAPGTIS